MEPSNQYLEFAMECERLAKQAKDEGHRKILLEMADVWRTLARDSGGKKN